MAYKLATPVLTRFTLDNTDKLLGVDPSDPTVIEVRQASQGDVDIRSSLTMLKTEYREKETVMTSELNWVRVHRKEVFLTLASCNITKPDGSPLFTFKNGRLEDEHKFVEAWNQLHPAAAQEIWEKVIEANPQWSMGGGSNDESGED